MLFGVALVIVSSLLVVMCILYFIERRKGRMVRVSNISLVAYLGDTNVNVILYVHTCVHGYLFNVHMWLPWRRLNFK